MRLELYTEGDLVTVPSMVQHSYSDSYNYRELDKMCYNKIFTVDCIISDKCVLYCTKCPKGLIIQTQLLKMATELQKALYGV